MTIHSAPDKAKLVLPDERAPLFLLALIFVCLKTGLEMSGNLAEVFYFRRVGVENLPLLYAIEPLAMVFLLVVFGRVIERANRQKLLIGLNLVFAALIILTYFLIRANWTQVYFVFYICQRIFFALLPLVFWLVCSDMFDIRQAKRLFVLIVAGGLVGTLLGNLLTGLLSGKFSPEGSLALTSIFFLGSLVGGFWLSKLSLPKSIVRPKLDNQTSLPPVLPFDLFKQPFLRIFSLLILITGMLEPVWRYEINAIANQSFASENSLIAFYGYFKGAAVVVVIIVQLFVVGKLINRMGLPGSISVHPLGLVGIMLLLGFFPTLGMAVVSVALIGIVRIGFDESGRKAIVGIYPLDERLRVSTFERQMTYLGIFLGSMLLMWAVKNLSMAQINWAAAGLAATWVLALPAFRAQYALACLKRGKSPIDQVDLSAAAENAGPGLSQFSKFLPGAELAVALQGAGLRSAALDGQLSQRVIQAGAQAIPVLQVALRSPVWAVRQFGLKCLLDGTQTPSAVEGLIASQLDYSDQLLVWRAIPKIHKLIKEQRIAAAQACLLLLEGRHPAGEMRVAARMLRSPVADVRANGLEALDISLRGSQKKRLLALFESALVSAEPKTEEAPAGKAAWDEIALAPDPEVAFWGQVWRLRSADGAYIPPVLLKDPIPAGVTALLAAVTYPQTGAEAMELAEKIDALRASETFAALSESELRVLAQCTREVNYPADTVIFEEGQVGNALYIILAGDVELASLEQRKSLQALNPGSVFGEYALFTTEPYTLTAVTISATRLLILERETFLELIQYYPNLSLSLLQNLARRFEKATALLQEIWV